MMRNAALILAAGLVSGALAGPAMAADRCQNTGDFDRWVEQFKKDALAQGISRRVIEAASPELVFDPSVIRRDQGQAVFQRTFLDFANRLIGGPRIPNGRAKIKQNSELFARIEKTYGVPREVIAAVWGLESDYGALFGKFKILPSLATLAYDCRRGEHFRPELMDALRIIQRGDRRVDQMTGNWAGEFGGMQFTPSNYIKYGVDFDGDGHRDLTDSVPDTLASAANYLKTIGWHPDQPWLQEVRVPNNLPWQEADLAIQHPRAQWVKWGVRAAHGSLPGDNLPASLILPMGRLGPAFLAYPNFKVFVDWNSSFIYATTVAYFATRLGGAPAVSEEGATRVKALTTEQMMELQRLLAERGHDVGEIDGRLGAGTRAATKAEQLKYKLPADSWPTEELIARLRNGGGVEPRSAPPPARVAPPPEDEPPPQSRVTRPPAHSTPPPSRAARPPAQVVRPPAYATKPPARNTARPARPAAPSTVTIRIWTTHGCRVMTVPTRDLRRVRRC